MTEHHFWSMTPEALTHYAFHPVIVKCDWYRESVWWFLREQLSD